MSINTPWGMSYDPEKVAEGITFHSTANHGGYELSADRYKAMPKHLRDAGGFNGPEWARWFEEDCEAMLVVAAFPEHFPYAKLHPERLRDGIQRHYPEAYDIQYPEEVTNG